jgi:hypothetical protein
MAKNIQLILRELFYFIFIAWLAFVILEIIFPNIILAYFNLNFLFLLEIMIGLFLLIKK